MLGRYGYTHHQLYRKTPYDLFCRLMREAEEIEREIREAQEAAAGG